MKRSKLQEVTYTVKPHPPQVPKRKPHFAKVYILTIFPNLEGRFVYLPPDVIIQGKTNKLRVCFYGPRIVMLHCLYEGL